MERGTGEPARPGAHPCPDRRPALLALHRHHREGSGQPARRRQGGGQPDPRAGPRRVRPGGRAAGGVAGDPARHRLHHLRPTQGPALRGGGARSRAREPPLRRGGRPERRLHSHHRGPHPRLDRLPARPGLPQPRRDGFPRPAEDKSLRGGRQHRRSRSPGTRPALPEPPGLPCGLCPLARRGARRRDRLRGRAPHPAHGRPGPPPRHPEPARAAGDRRLRGHARRRHRAGPRPAGLPDRTVLRRLGHGRDLPHLLRMAVAHRQDAQLPGREAAPRPPAGDRPRGPGRPRAGCATGSRRGWRPRPHPPRGARARRRHGRGRPLRRRSGPRHRRAHPGRARGGRRRHRRLDQWHRHPAGAGDRGGGGQLPAEGGARGRGRPRPQARPAPPRRPRLAGLHPDRARGGRAGLRRLARHDLVGRRRTRHRAGRVRGPERPGHGLSLRRRHLGAPLHRAGGPAKPPSTAS